MNKKFLPRTFGRKRGRNKNFSVDQFNYLQKKYRLLNYDLGKNPIIEIGSGNGENTIKLCKINPKNNIIACEVYKDGNFSLMKKIHKQNIKNVNVFNDNFLLLLKNIPKNSIEEYWLLFPDPWPKKRHNKRRIINSEFLERLCFTLKKNGRIFIATDNSNYFLSIMMKILKLDYLKWENDRFYLWENPFDNMVKTVFYLKAKKNGEKPVFILLKKNI